MSAFETDPCSCQDPEEILADLDADLLDMQPGERLWKVYCFRVAGHITGLRHRIYSKLKADGRLALVTFAVHNPPRVRQGQNGDPGEPAAVRSGIARVGDLSADDLERIISSVRRQSGATDAYEEVDLSVFGTLAEQIAWLEGGSDNVPESG